ncbi:MAG: hypothetical protein WHT07_06935 [Desulfobaccales bacterium]
MKVDPHLTLVRGESTAPRCQNSSRPPASPQAGPPFRDLLTLVSQENQRARELQPHTVEEAQRLLNHLVTTLKSESPEILSETHRLQAPYLIRLR